MFKPLLIVNKLINKTCQAFYTSGPVNHDACSNIRHVAIRHGLAHTEIREYQIITLYMLYIDFFFVALSCHVQIIYFLLSAHFVFNREKQHQISHKLSLKQTFKRSDSAINCVLDEFVYLLIGS